MRIKQKERKKIIYYNDDDEDYIYIYNTMNIDDYMHHIDSIYSQRCVVLYTSFVCIIYIIISHVVKKLYRRRIKSLCLLKGVKILLLFSFF